MLAIAVCLLVVGMGSAEEVTPGDGSPDDRESDSFQKGIGDGMCKYLDFDEGVAVNTDNAKCGTPPKCSTANTALNEYECLNGDDVGCCKWDEDEVLSKCSKDKVERQLYKAADTCCDETSESCNDDGWPKSCNLGCGAIMVPLVDKCLSAFSTIGLSASATPLKTATKLCPCAAEILACDQDKDCNKALDILPDLIVPEYGEYFTQTSSVDPENHFNAGTSATKLALLKCYKAQHYPTTGGMGPGGPGWQGGGN